MKDKLFTPPQLAEHFGVTVQKLAQDRYLGRGPKFIKLGHSVRYRESDVLAWLDANTHEGTAA
ncbi:MAG: helix-turn-helix transcriptional regulator [Galactobacter sp.]